MNGIVHRVLRLTSHEMVVKPTMRTLNDLNHLASSYSELGPIPSSLVVSKLVGAALETNAELTSVHKKTLNALTVNIVNSVAQLPSPLALKVFNMYARSGHPQARQILTALQDRWFENWNPASVQKGSNRPKKKQPIHAMYSSQPRGEIPISNINLLKTIDDDTLFESVKSLKHFKGNGGDLSDLGHIAVGIVNEFKSRRSLGNTEIPTELVSFINGIG
jgi:hypothetical protein